MALRRRLQSVIWEKAVSSSPLKRKWAKKQNAFALLTGRHNGFLGEV